MNIKVSQGAAVASCDPGTRWEALPPPVRPRAPAEVTKLIETAKRNRYELASNK
jgi:hypothetical protein